MEWELPNGNGMGVLAAFLLASGTDITIVIDGAVDSLFSGCPYICVCVSLPCMRVCLGGDILTGR